MARLARVVAPGFPHRVTQRASAVNSAPLREASETGNRRCKVFWDPCDRDRYEACLPEYGAMIPDWAAWLADEVPAETNAIRRNTPTARPRGATDFVRRLETLLGRPLLPQKPGRKPTDPKETSPKDGNA